MAPGVRTGCARKNISEAQPGDTIKAQMLNDCAFSEGAMKFGKAVECPAPGNRGVVCAENEQSAQKVRETLGAAFLTPGPGPRSREEGRAGVTRTYCASCFLVLPPDTTRTPCPDCAAEIRKLDGIRISKRTPEARAKFSKLLRERWQNTEWRAKYLASALVRCRKNAAKAKGRKQSPEHVAKRTAGRSANRQARAE